MQTRQSQFKQGAGCQQSDAQGSLHRHGPYLRYCSPDGEDRFGVPRYLCTRCGLTTSVLPDDRLPYRSILTRELEASFDSRTQVDGAAPALPDPPPPVPPVSEKKSGCFDRAWTAWVRNSRHIAELLGHLLPRQASEEAALCWRALRKAFGIEAMLAMLSSRFKTSLLLDYRCLKPGTPRLVRAPC